MALGLLLITTPAVNAVDCNGNGVDDAIELATCPDIDLVVVLDTSNSMVPIMSRICEKVEDAVADLAEDGLTFHSEFLGIELGTSCSCESCETTLPNVHARYGATATGYPDVPHLGTCSPEADGNEEDWAPATAIVAANKV